MKWKKVPGHPNYEVSDTGRVRSLDHEHSYTNRWGTQTRRRVRGRELTPQEAAGGYLIVCLGRGTCCLVHHLVLDAFTGPRPEGLECRHLNGNPSDNRLSNLRWGTVEENRADSVRHRTNSRPSLRGANHPGAKFTKRRVEAVRRMVESGATQKEIAKRFGVTRQAVSNIVRGKSWGWL